MMPFGIVNLLDRCGVMTEDARNWRKFISQCIAEISIARKTVPVGLRRVLENIKRLDVWTM